MNHARILVVALCLPLSGCFWSHSKTELPEPATTQGLQSSEDRLDHLTEKRDSRVAAAVSVASQRADDKVVKGELEVAKAMLADPARDDLEFAKARAAKGDEAFYAEQVNVSRQLAKAIVDANCKYEQEKAKKQAEYESKVKQKEMELDAERKARTDDKFTYAGIGLLAIGMIALFASPLKKLGAAFAFTGLILGSIPYLQEQPWFKYAIGGSILASILAGIGWFIYEAKTAEKKANNEPNVPNTPN